MKRYALVSIVIPTYKRPDMLGRAIESAINQTYEDIEVIVVDDNDSSSEYRKQTEEVVRKYMDLENFKYIKLEKNSGGCVARNVGLNNSSGDYINFLDDDDSFELNKIEKQIKMFWENNNLAVVGCFAKVIDSKGELKRIEKEELKGDVFKYQLAKNICTTSLALIKKDVLIKSGGFEQMPSSQEHLLFIKIFSINPFYDYVPETLVNINHHMGERISNNKKKPLGAIALFEYTKQYFNTLDSKEMKFIKESHYENILRSYLVIGDKKNSVIYLKKLIKSKERIDLNIIKLSTLIAIGIDNAEKVKRILKRSNK